MKLWVSKVGGDDKVRSPTYCSRLITDSRRIKKKKKDVIWLLSQDCGLLWAGF